MMTVYSLDNSEAIEMKIKIPRVDYINLEYKAKYEKSSIAELILNAIKRSANNAKKYKDML